MVPDIPNKEIKVDFGSGKRMYIKPPSNTPIKIT